MRSFLGFGQAQYIGTPFAQAVKLAGISTQVIPLLFQWISYGAATAKPNINVLVDINTKPCAPLDQIRSVYIDNLGSDNPIYVRFPDTNYTIVAAPNSEGWYPAFTNARQVWVIGEGFLTGNIPQTFILLSNVFISPAVNLEINQSIGLQRASPVISRGTSIYNSAFGVPALGDQFQSSIQLQMVAGSNVPLWNTPFASGFLYITAMQLNLVAVVGPATAQIVIESTGVAGTLLGPLFFAPAGASPGVLTLMQLTGLQLKLDATQTWRMRAINSLTSGSAQLLSSFTQQP